MRHARPAALDRLEDLLTALRGLDGLAERSRGVFYRRSRAFLHFHEEGDALYADLRGAADFDRHDVTAPPGRRAFLREVRRRLDTD